MNHPYHQNQNDHYQSDQYQSDQNLSNQNLSNQNLSDQALNYQIASIKKSNDLKSTSNLLLKHYVTLLSQTYLEEYLGDEDFTLSTDKTMDLLTSLKFTLDLALRSKAYKKAPEHYQDGRALLDLGRLTLKELLHKSRLRYKALLPQLILVDNRTYNETVRDAIQGFFKHYRPDFFAHDRIITADYPTALPATQLLGAEFINVYIRHLTAEHVFLQKFELDALKRLYRFVSADDIDVIFNLFEPAIQHALIESMLYPSRIPMLALTAEDIDTFHHRYRDTTYEALTRDMRTALKRIFKALNLSDAYVQSYCVTYMNSITIKLLTTITSLGVGNFVAIETFQKCAKD